MAPVQVAPLSEAVNKAAPSQEGLESDVTAPVSSSPSQDSPITPRNSDESFDEEDRLAFLRAQAAQDAALARLGSAHARGPNDDSSPRNDRGPGGPGGAGGRRNTRGRRGGKFRRGDNNRNRTGPSTGRGPRPFGYASGPQKWDDGGAKGGAAAGGREDSDSSSSDSSGSDGGGKGGGDHSQPPA